MDKVRWLVDSKIFHDEEELLGLVKAINGARVQSDLVLTKYVMFQDDLTTITSILTTPTPTVVYGTINFIKQVFEMRRFLKSDTPIFAYGFSSDIDCLSYMPRVPQSQMLNQNYVMVPFVRFVEGGNFWYDTFNTNAVFIRPNTGTKVFTGQVIPRKEFDYEINALRQLSGVTDSTLILVAPAQTIKTESRFIIADKKVIHGVKYVENGKNHYDTSFESNEPPNNAKVLAQYVGRFPWQIDHAYVVDIATLEDGTAKVVEFNAFSSAGFYTTNYQQIVDGINQMTEQVVLGNLVLER